MLVGVCFYKKYTRGQKKCADSVDFFKEKVYNKSDNGKNCLPQAKGVVLWLKNGKKLMKAYR